MSNAEGKNNKPLGEEHRRTLESMYNLVKFYEVWGKPEHAEQWQGEAAS